MNKLQIEHLPLAALTPYENNARKHEAADLQTIENSIAEFGMCDPIGIWSDKNIIVEGHGRYLALKKLGYTEVPCIRLDHLSDEQRKAYGLAHNRTAEMSEWDFSALQQELDEIEMDMEQFGFADTLLHDYDEDQQEESEVVQDDVPDVDDVKEPRVQRGQVWKLGNHRLMCGDSTSEHDVSVLMDGAKADMVFTDPPYGMKKESDGVANDNLNYDDLLQFNKKWIPLTFAALKEVGSWYCWGIDEPLMDIYSEILKPMKKQNKITFRNLITWDKGHGQGQTAAEFRMYPIADEKCLFVMCGVQGFNTNADNYYEGWEPIRQYLLESKKAMGWNDDDITRITGVTTVARHAFGRSQWEMPTEENYKKLQAAAKGDAFKREYDELKREYDELKREYYSKRAFFDNTHDNMNNVWHFERTTGEERQSAGGHATPKPIALCARAIKSSSRSGEIVLDVFGGSGSTLIACEQLHRKCYAMELEPKWCDVIIKRWEDFTGLTAQLAQS